MLGAVGAVVIFTSRMRMAANGRPGWIGRWLATSGFDERGRGEQSREFAPRLLVVQEMLS